MLDARPFLIQKSRKIIAMSSMNRKRSASDSRLNGCMEIAIEKLYEQHDKLLESSPLLGVGILLVIATAEDLVRTRKESVLIHRQNLQAAQLRNDKDQRQAGGSIETRLLKDPVKTVSELRTSYRGCMDLIGLWSGLGSVLLKKNGWNEMEIKMACSLLGINHEIRCSREWTRLDRGMNADKARPFKALEMNLQSQLREYSKDFSERMAELYPAEQSAYAVGLCMMQEWRLGLEYRLEANRYYDLKAYEKWRMDEITSRKYWVDTRRFVAMKIRELRREAAFLINQNDSSSGPIALLKFTSQELKAAEWARKMLVSSISNFQKSMAMAKSIGLLGDGKSKKAPKTDPVSVMDMEPASDPISGQTTEESVVDKLQSSDEKVVKAKRNRKSSKSESNDNGVCKLKLAEGSSQMFESGMISQTKRISSPFKASPKLTLCDLADPHEAVGNQVLNASSAKNSGSIIKPVSLNRLAEADWKRQTGANDENEEGLGLDPRSQ